MDVKEYTSVEERKRLSKGECFPSLHRPLCFDLTDSKITSYVPISSNSPPIPIPFHTSDHMKALGLHVFERARAQRIHSPLTELELVDDDSEKKEMENSQVVYSTAVYSSSEEDLETESDAGTCDIEGFEEEDCGDDAVFYRESVKKKIEFLAEMVGVNSGCPAVVLAKVVRVLKELEKDRENMGGAQNVTRVLLARMDKD